LKKTDEKDYLLIERSLGEDFGFRAVRVVAGFGFKIGVWG